MSMAGNYNTARYHSGNHYRSESPVMKFKRILGSCSPKGNKLKFESTSNYSSNGRKENMRYKASFKDDEYDFE